VQKDFSATSLRFSLGCGISRLMNSSIGWSVPSHLTRSSRQRVAQVDATRKTVARLTHSTFPSLLQLDKPLEVILKPAASTLLATMDQAQNAMAQISQGSLAAIFDETPGRVQQPIVQCVQIKPIASQEGNLEQNPEQKPEQKPELKPERYRVVFSDVRNYVQTMLATAANGLVKSGQLKRGCIVKLMGYQANAIKGRRYGGAAVCLIHI